MAISRLNSVNQIVSGDQIPIGSQTNGDDRRIAASVLLAYIQAGLTFPAAGAPKPTTQYAVPSASGFNVQITDGSADIHLILTPTAGYAAGTITLPTVTNCVDKQEIIVNCTQQITALTINPNGATAVTGEPLSMGADDFFRLKFDIISSTWYRIG